MRARGGGSARVGGGGGDASRASAELVDPSVAYKSDSQSGLAGFERGEGRSEHAFREEAGLLVP